MPDMMFPVVVLVIIGFLTLSFLMYLVDNVCSDEICDEAIDNQDDIQK